MSRNSSRENSGPINFAVASPMGLGFRPVTSAAQLKDQVAPLCSLLSLHPTLAIASNSPRANAKSRSGFCHIGQNKSRCVDSRFNESDERAFAQRKMRHIVKRNQLPLIFFIDEVMY